MRQTLLIAALFSSLALAQAANEVGSDGTTPEGSATIAPPPQGTSPEGAQDVPPAAAGRDAANAQHTVSRGDTLWDLSTKYLGSPWYWPKVWSYNPEIANPHWIYPGNTVRFFQTGEEVPTQVEVGQQPSAPDVEEGSMVADEDRVVVTGQLVYKNRSAQSLALPALVTAGEIEASGQIVGSFSEMQMLTAPEAVYVRFNDGHTPKLGETYVVFRPGEELTHPVSGESVGFYTRIMGEVKVVRAERGGLATMQIVRSFDEIERTDLIGPSGEPLVRQVAARPADREVLGGMIVSQSPGYRTLAGQNSVVVIDRGSEQGVKVGNVFTFWRQHDGISAAAFFNPSAIDDQYPRETVGQCIAADVKSRATLCLVSAALRELIRGDRADIQLGSARSARR
jgi:hypothetical protein